MSLEALLKKMWLKAVRKPVQSINNVKDPFYGLE